MEINKVQDLLNTIAKELFPDLRLEFLVDRKQMFIQTAFIMAQSPIHIDVKEVVHNNVFNTARAKNILEIRTHAALMQLKNYVQNSLDKLEWE